MMTTEEILKLRNQGELSTVQFKERLMNNYDIEIGRAHV